MPAFRVEFRGHVIQLCVGDTDKAKEQLRRLLIVGRSSLSTAFAEVQKGFRDRSMQRSCRGGNESVRSADHRWR